MAATKAQNDDKMILALLSCKSVKQAAKKCGCTERTLYRRLQEPEFKARYDADRRAMFERASTGLQLYVADAIEAMGEIVADKKASQQTRLNAADAIIRNTLKLTERCDILDRLDALERRVQ